MNMYKNILILEGRDFTPGNPKLNPPDPPTKNGIIQSEYEQYRIKAGYPVQSVQFITDFEAQTIYMDKYFYGHKINLLPDGLDFAVFQAIVNEEGQGIKFLQAVLGVTQDNGIGPNTLTALARISGESLNTVIVGTLNNQDAHYVDIYALGMDSTDIKGLHNRVSMTAAILGLSLV